MGQSPDRNAPLVQVDDFANLFRRVHDLAVGYLDDRAEPETEPGLAVMRAINELHARGQVPWHIVREGILHWIDPNQSATRSDLLRALPPGYQESVRNLVTGDAADQGYHIGALLVVVACTITIDRRAF